MNASTDDQQTTDDHKARAEAWFKELRDRICSAFEAIEDDFGECDSDKPAGRFEPKPLDRAEGGGGVRSIMRGRVVGVVPAGGSLMKGGPASGVVLSAGIGVLGGLVSSAIGMRSFDLESRTLDW